MSQLGVAALILTQPIDLKVISAGLFLEHNPNRPANVSTYSAFASCSGVSIFLVDACRSVGIPARMTGIAQWVSVGFSAAPALTCPSGSTSPAPLAVHHPPPVNDWGPATAHQQLFPNCLHPH